MPTNGKERTGYPTQKPVGIARRIIQASCPPGGTVMDFFAGSGTVGEAALELGRRFILIDDNPEALAVMARRFADCAGRGVCWVSTMRRIGMRRERLRSRAEGALGGSNQVPRGAGDEGSRFLAPLGMTGGVGMAVGDAARMTVSAMTTQKVAASSGR